MARQQTPAPQSKETPANQTVIEAERSAANTLALAQQEQSVRVVALATQLNYHGSTDVAALENSARDAIRRIGMAVFELGAYLLLLREMCPHGAFLPTLERLNLEQRAARQYMQVTKRFANRQTSADLNALGVSKLTEMLVLDDEQLAELTELGQTGELALDKVATMSVRELRAALREAHADKEADAALLEKKNAKIDKLERDVRRIAKLPPDDALAALQREATAVMNDTRGAVIGGLRQALLKLREEHPESEASDVFMAGLVGQVQADLTDLREEFQLPDVSNAADRELAGEVAQWGGKS